MHVAALNVTFPTDGHTFYTNELTPAVFQCTATGNPEPVNISWYSNEMVFTGARVNLSDPETTLVTTDRGSTFQLSQALTLDDARDEDSGSYSCQAETADGTKVNQTFELFVRSKISL